MAKPRDKKDNTERFWMYFYKDNPDHAPAIKLFKSLKGRRKGFLIAELVQIAMGTPQGQSAVFRHVTGQGWKDTGKPAGMADNEDASETGAADQVWNEAGDWETRLAEQEASEGYAPAEDAPPDMSSETTQEKPAEPEVPQSFKDMKRRFVA